MFKEFVDLFLKLKVENSGFPDYILNIVDPNARVAAKLQYIFDYEEREGIRLSYPDIQLNQTQRFICKLILNRFVKRIFLYLTKIFQFVG